MTATPPIQAPEEESSLLEILTILLKRWRTVIVVPLTVAVLVFGMSFLVSPTYTGTTSFVPEVRSEGVSAGLAGIAGQLGISFGAEASQSPQFYAQVAKSREILTRLLLARYADPRVNGQPGDSATLLIILGKGGRNHADSLERGIKHLAGRLLVGVDAQTNVVTLKAELLYPDLAASVPNRLVAYLNDFNAQSRQSQARERRKFTEQRVAAGEQDLSSSEEALKRFYQANRSWQQSPQLMFEEGQLKRQVDLRQELYRTLRREYETARIEEVNDTPVITVIDAAVPPQRKSSPKRTLWALVAGVLSGIFAVSWAFGAEYVLRAKREEYAPYRDLASTARQMRHAFRDALSSITRRPKRAPRDL